MILDIQYFSWKNARYYAIRDNSELKNSIEYNRIYCYEQCCQGELMDLAEFYVF